jgi:hypothetical protein
MGRFDVFVDGVSDGSPQGVTRAGQTLAKGLGKPVDQVVRMLAGRFRVRSDVDDEKASQLKQSLENMGLRVSLVPVEPEPQLTLDDGVSVELTLSGLKTTPDTPSPPPTAEPGPQIELASAASMLNELSAASGGGHSHNDRSISLDDDDMPLSLQTEPTRNERPGGVRDLEVARTAHAGPAPVMPAAAAAAPPARDPAAPARPKQDAHAGAAHDPFAPPPDESDMPVELMTEVERPLRKPTPVQAISSASASGRAMAAARAVSATKQVPLPALIRRAAAIGFVALAIGYFPGSFYAHHVDSRRVLALQTELQDLRVNTWKTELTKRSPAMVRNEIDDVRWRASVSMMGIWTASSTLVVALAYLLL